MIVVAGPSETLVYTEVLISP